MAVGELRENKHRGFKLLGRSFRWRSRDTEDLQKFVLESDPSLAASLQQDERRRRRLHLRSLAGVLAILALQAGLLWVIFKGPAGNLPAAKRAASSGAAATRAEIGSADELSELGWKQLRAMQLDKANASFELALELDPDRASAWIGLGWIHWEKGEPGAEQAFRRALELEPYDPLARYSLGNLYFEKGDFERAEPLLRGVGSYQEKLAALYLLEGRFDDAAQVLDKAQGKVARQQLVQEMKRAAASHQLDEELRRRIQPTRLHEALPAADQGWRLFEQGKLEEAAAAFERALRETPKDQMGLRGLGWTSLKRGQQAKAEETFREVLKLWPDEVTSLNGLARSLKEQGRVDEAIAVWERMCRVYPHLAHDGTRGLAWTYYERGDYRRAAVHLAKLLKDNPDDKKAAEALEVSLQKSERQGD
ncbi:MAG TPA: tetratricopeptide repeat protein [Thermoanaerobaculia bacterium]|nr:tetratricopeptide repeat protein [Thermoanaerobaculia bacterium]